jgi:hypothetical protein
MANDDVVGQGKSRVTSQVHTLSTAVQAVLSDGIVDQIACGSPYTGAAIDVQPTPTCLGAVLCNYIVGQRERAGEFNVEAAAIIGRYVKLAARNECSGLVAQGVHARVASVGAA